MEDEKVKQLAETLKKQGLAVSMYEAMEKAKSILNVKSQNNTETWGNTNRQQSGQKIIKSQENVKWNMDNSMSQERQSDKLRNSDYDITKETASLNELMQEIGVTEEQIGEQEKQKIEQIKQEVNEIREDLREADQNPEKIEEIKEELSHVNEEIDELIEERDENAEMQPEQEQNQEENQSEEKNNIDLTKVFGYKK